MEIAITDFRKYAKAHNMVILAFRRESYSGEVIGITVKKGKSPDGTPFFCFGRLYHVFGDRFTFDQCGCYFTTDEREVRLEAYKHFGID